MADAAMLSIFPLEISVHATDLRTMRRPRTWQMFGFMRLRMRLSIEKSPPISILLSYIRAFCLVYGISLIY